MSRPRRHGRRRTRPPYCSNARLSQVGRFRPSLRQRRRSTPARSGSQCAPRTSLPPAVGRHVRHRLVGAIQDVAIGRRVRRQTAALTLRSSSLRVRGSRSRSATRRTGASSRLFTSLQSASRSTLNRGSSNGSASTLLGVGPRALHYCHDAEPRTTSSEAVRSGAGTRQYRIVCDLSTHLGHGQLCENRRSRRDVVPP